VRKSRIYLLPKTFILSPVAFPLFDGMTCSNTLMPCGKFGTLLIPDKIWGFGIANPP
jgi:hypothetical protein